MKKPIIFIALLTLPIMVLAQGKITRPTQKSSATTIKRSSNKKKNTEHTDANKKNLASSSSELETTPKLESQSTSNSYMSEPKLTNEQKRRIIDNYIATMVYVRGGTFTMGATSEMTDSWRNENTAHQVTLSGFYIGQTEVTQSLWKSVMDYNPSKFVGDNLPVENVSWNDCQEFITKLNNLTGANFRLPTEAEWEFAARGGNSSNHTRYSGSGNIDYVGWYGENSGSKTHPVAQKQSNELGIYDMTGNVWEWCSDWDGNYSSSPQINPKGPDSGTLRVGKGGSCKSFLSDCRSCSRCVITPGGRSEKLGLRLCISENKMNLDMTNSHHPNPQVRQSIKSQTYTANSVSFEMMRVESGTFTMGATSEMDSRNSDEKPTHSVTLSGFYIGQTEVTQALWKAVMGNNPSKNKGDNLPVESVSWDDCQNFISKLNIITGKHFRLPTEAEWEFAARGGNNSNHTQYSGSGNIDDVAWYGGNGGNSGRKTHPVAQKQANELGIYDMSGNVYEWCSDWFDSYSSATENNPVGPSNGTSRVFRGGCCDFDMWSCRCSYRARSVPSYHNNALGVRLCISQ